MKTENSNIITNNDEKKRLLDTRRGAVILSVGIMLSLIVVKLLFPHIIKIMAVMFPICMMNYIGLHCPLCGGTHCIAALVHGNIAKAVYYNPFVFVGAIYLILLYVRLVLSCFAAHYKRMKLLVNWYFAGWVMLAAAVVFFVVRNLPFYRAVLY